MQSEIMLTVYDNLTQHSSAGVIPVLTRDDMESIIDAKLSSMQPNKEIMVTLESFRHDILDRCGHLRDNLAVIRNTQQAQLTGEVNMPLLFLLEKVTTSEPTSSKLVAVVNQLRHAVSDEYHLKFLCTVCGCAGNTYRIRLTKETLLKFVQGLVMVLKAVELIGVCSGMPIPPISSLIQRINGAIPKDIRKTVSSCCDSLLQDPTARDELLRLGLSNSFRDHKFKIQELLILARDKDARATGLDCVMCSDGSCTWVCKNESACKDTLRRLGSKALLVQSPSTGQG
jgi:hypothetical protein